MKRRGTVAFTLVEVLMAIAIFALLAGGIFASVRAGFDASTAIVEEQLESERMDAFRNLVRRFFTNLPADAKVELRVRQVEGLGDVIEVLAWPVPGFLKFGRNEKDGIALTALPDGKGSYVMSIGYFRAEDGPNERDRDLADGPWLRLLPDVRKVRWRFAPARNPIYSETWTAANGRPGIAELSMQLSTDEETVQEYWLPPLQRGRGGRE